MILGIAHTALLVHEYDEAIAFYRDVLGFAVVEDTPMDGGKRWVRLRAAGGQGSDVLLSRAVDDVQRAMVGKQAGGRVLFFLHTDSFDEDFAQLQKHDVRVTEGPRKAPHGDVAVFLDLYGNRIDLIGPPKGAEKPRPDCIRYAPELPRTIGTGYDQSEETFSHYARLTRDVGFQKISANYEVLPPGTRTSWPHAHLVEEEALFVLEGHPQVWIDGEVYDLKPGDSVGFLPGTGVGHCFLNNTDRDAVLLVIGECEVPDEKLFYPMHPDRDAHNKAKGRYWEGHPRPKLGPHDGKPDAHRGD